MSKKENDFDYITEIENLEVPDMLKVGFKFYIERNDLKIQDKKEFDKVLDKFKKIKMGD
ncbi:MAG: hypothetical protein IJ258_05395 [Methanobrevibacter sp.]|uniref:hypothetical protein n=1 Tax=Methanobrevibacter sp. TaxID=66852 RepID=UPI0025DE8261|nr:hypothetical protein [Methanobrevibacter sp.]MBQ8017525.1 hypothetical protein [Methanobrevibacter sp.]